MLKYGLSLFLIFVERPDRLYLKGEADDLATLVRKLRRDLTFSVNQQVIAQSLAPEADLVSWRHSRPRG